MEKYIIELTNKLQNIQLKKDITFRNLIVQVPDCDKKDGIKEKGNTGRVSGDNNKAFNISINEEEIFTNF